LCVVSGSCIGKKIEKISFLVKRSGNLIHTDHKLNNMPHGDPSDFAALFCLTTGLAAIFTPHLYMMDIGPISPLLGSCNVTGEHLTATQETDVLLSIFGSMLVLSGLVLFSVRWNTTNGKASGFGFLLAALNCVKIALQLDDELVFRGWWIFAVVFVLTALHLIFNANPLWTSASLREREQAKQRKTDLEKSQ
jgi:hypothetical protein